MAATMGINNWVDLPAPQDYTVMYEPLKWAKQHCPSYITNDAVQRDGDYYYRFYFGQEQDRVMFLLRWS